MIECVGVYSLIFLSNSHFVSSFHLTVTSGAREKGRKVKKQQKTVEHKLKLSNWHFLSFYTSNIVSHSWYFHECIESLSLRFVRNNCKKNIRWEGEKSKNSNNRTQNRIFQISTDISYFFILQILVSHLWCFHVC